MTLSDYNNFILFCLFNYTYNGYNIHYKKSCIWWQF